LPLYRRRRLADRSVGRPADPSRHPGAGAAAVIGTGTASTAWHRTGRVITGLPGEGRTEVTVGHERMPQQRPRTAATAASVAAPGARTARDHSLPSSP